MDILKNEFARNVTGYFLVIIGMVAVGYGGHFHFDKMVDLGASLVTASLVAFQAKRTPDGNTTTTSVTVPPPAIAAPLDTPASPKP
jgi:hypothetical protein